MVQQDFICLLLRHKTYERSRGPGPSINQLTLAIDVLFSPLPLDALGDDINDHGCDDSNNKYCDGGGVSLLEPFD